jgi:phospholipase/carboxylesterase
MDVTSMGSLRVFMRGGVDRQGGGNGPAILRCHGFGAPGNDLVSLARVVDVGRDVRWFFPEAPLEVDVGPGVSGRAWWDIGMEQLMTHLMRGDIDAAMKRLDEIPPGLEPAKQALSSTIEVLAKEHGVTRDRLIIGGFSQGAMLATEMFVSSPEPFAGLVVLSGTRLGGDMWKAGLSRHGAHLHALVTHGRRDPLLPFGRAEVLRDMMKQAGADVTWVAHGGAHEIPAVCLDALGTFVRARLGATS